MNPDLERLLNALEAWDEAGQEDAAALERRFLVLLEGHLEGHQVKDPLKLVIALRRMLARKQAAENKRPNYRKPV